MRFICLDGSEISIDISSANYPRRYDVSKAQLRVGDFLEEILPNQNILEEFVIPKSGGLRIDFFLPIMKVAVEVDGGQHKKLTPHFHKNKAGFELAQKNDKLKNEWCRINGVRIIRVDDSCTKEELDCQI